MTLQEVQTRHVEIMEKKMGLDAEIQGLKERLDTARSAMRNGKNSGIHPNLYNQWKHRLGLLGHESQALQLEIRKLKLIEQDMNRNSVDKCFMLIARHRLDSGLYAKLVAEAVTAQTIGITEYLELIMEEKAKANEEVGYA